MDFVRAQMTEEERREERLCNNIADAVAERLARPQPAKMLTGAQARALEHQRKVDAEQERRSQVRHKAHLYAQVPSLRHLVK